MGRTQCQKRQDLDRRAEGQLHIILSSFARHLRVRGYGQPTIRAYQAVAGEFLRNWLERGRRLGALNEERIRCFVHAWAARARRHRWPSYRVRICRRALQCLLGVLREEHHVAPPPCLRPTAAERLLDRYDQHLTQVHGLVAGTRLGRRQEARLFLHWWRGQGHRRFHQLGFRDLSRYLRQRVRGLRPSTRPGAATGLRSFLRYLAWSRQCGPWLAQAVLAPAPWPRSNPPRHLTLAEYGRFLAAFDRSRPVGRRDYAMALCSGELGLRASEVAGLKLEDVEWQRRTLHLARTKQGQERRLPLPLAVAGALADYLRQGRPPSRSGQVFVRHRPPVGEPLRPGQVGAAMSGALARSGSAQRGAHVLRHTLATRLHRCGVDLKAISDLLGHQGLSMTARYAQVDVQELRQAALPWPEGWR